MNTPDQVRSLLGGLVDREGGGPPDWAERLASFLDLLEQRNRQINLVSRRTVSQALVKHVLPSLASLRVVPAGRRIHVLDVGSGGGFPGIPLALLRPDARIDLIDGSRKKCGFLTDCIEFLQILNASVHWCRVENPAGALLERAPFEVILARAVGAAGKLRRACLPLMRPGGGIWIFAAPGAGQGPIEWKDLGGEIVTTLRNLAEDDAPLPEDESSSEGSHREDSA